MINQCMSQTARCNAGLGDPPLPYYTNDSESANAMIKRAVNFKEKEISDFVREMSVLLQQQKDDVESAIFNKGPYEQAEPFKHFFVSERDWFRKRNEQRNLYMERFHKAKLSKGEESEATGIVPAPTSATSAPCGILSVDLLGANISSIPAATLQAIVKNSEDLLSREGAIIPAPGNNKAYMVESQTSSKPHFVEIKKNGMVVCDGCPSFAAAKLCAHSVAASEKAGVLEKFLSWFMKNGPSSMNLTSFITYDSSKDTGKKLSKSSNGRRKGGRSRGAGPATTIVDRQFDRNNSSPQPPVQQPPMSSSHTVPQPPPI